MLFLPFIKGLHADEKVWSLFEEDTLTEDGKRLIRVQTTRVFRDDKLVEFTRELGPAADFTAEPFTIASLGAHSVGQVMEMAEKLRRDNGLQRAMDDHREEFDPIALMVQRAEQIAAYRKQNHRTVQNTRTA